MELQNSAALDEIRALDFQRVEVKEDKRRFLFSMRLASPGHHVPTKHHVPGKRRGGVLVSAGGGSEERGGTAPLCKAHVKYVQEAAA
jgi:hypothetical protein